METQEQVTAPEAAEQAAATAPDLTINDLQNLRTIIDVATRRGAFGASELSSVGTTFDRLNTFLNAVAPAAPADAGQQPPSA